jgi:small subunit ribosomal protein S16
MLVGRRNHAEFRVVATESTKGPKSSNYLEVLGHYNPHTNVATFEADRIKHWISVGAQVSDTVHNLLVTHKIIEGKKINVLPKKTAPAKAEEKVEETKPEAQEAVVEEAAEAPEEEQKEAVAAE